MALEYFKFARKYDSLNANINYLVGYCYLSHPIAKHEAEYYLEIASSKITRNYEPFEPDVDGGLPKHRNKPIRIEHSAYLKKPGVLRCTRIFLIFIHFIQLSRSGCRTR